MKVFGHPLGYKFFMENDSWRELTKEEKAKFKLGKQYLTYLVNPGKQKEFFVALDGFYKNAHLEDFYQACKKTFTEHNYIIENEEFCTFFNPKKEKINCIKAFVKKPDETHQTSYFMKLTGNTPKGVGYGCLTTFTKEAHDENEAFIVEAITNWEYFDAK